MTLEEKAEFLTGKKMHTKAYPGMDKVEMSDGPSGVHITKKCKSLDGGDVAFPTASAQAATWNTELIREIGHQIALNCIEREIDMILAPAVNLHRNPLCGRNYEYYSEDPYLSGEMGVAYIQGIQEYGVGTSLKHFAANHQENLRGVVNAEIAERPLREIYLAAFETIIKRANPTTVMCAYNKINGLYCSENKKLLTDILRDEWEYDGTVISDWGAVHNVARSVKAGMDLIMPERETIVSEVKEHINNQELTEADIDRAADNIIKLIKRIKSMRKAEIKFDRSKAHEVATDVEREAIVLIKNENILPIKPSEHKKIGVVGYFAENPMICTSLMSSGGVSVEEKSIDNPLEIIREYAGDTDILYAPLYNKLGGDLSFNNMIDIQKISKECDLIIMFAGYNDFWEIEGEDRENLELPPYMVRLIDECSRYCENTVVITQTGSPYAPFIRLAQPKAILQMWYGGEGAGRAIADVLFGKVNPSGKLPSTFMKKMNPDIEFSYDGRYIDYKDGLFVGYRYYDKHKDLIWYPFGHGLSYTTFEYSDILTETTDNLNVTVSFNIKNTGKVLGKEVCQVYVKPLECSVVRPEKELKGFAKIELKPGEIKRVSIKLDKRAFSYYNTNENDWHEESGMYDILVGASSQDIRLCSAVEIKNNDDYTILRERWCNGARKELVGGNE